ncbi:MAG: ComEC/Rec2 family competence protein [Aquificota bacterium]|nr:ComEC/Rec2 family competence protein [Aquificota bacterium]
MTGKELVHAVLFLLAVAVAWIRSSLPDFREEDVYFRVKIRGDVLSEGARTVTRVVIEECEIDELEGRKGTLVVYGELLRHDRDLIFTGDVRVRDNRVFIYASGRDVEYAGSGEGKARAFLMRRYVEASRDADVVPLGLSFLFGEPRDLLPSSVQRSFLETGLVHLLVISGLHVGTIALILSRMLPYFWGLKASLAGTVLYTVLVVPREPPVLRATLMIVLVLLCHLSFRQPNYVAILLFSGTVILLLFPHYIFSYSFWLSFLATAYIILSLRDFRRGKVSGAVLVSISAFTGVAPLISTFSYISPLSVLLTPLLAPLVFLYSLFGVLSLITLMGFPPFVDLFNLLGGLFVFLVGLASDLSFQVYPETGVYEALLLSAGGLVGLYFLEGRARLIPLAVVNGWLMVRSAV